MSTPRMRKVNSILREVLADEIELLTDPRLEMVSVTGVETSPDLRKAVVFISVLDLERGADAVEALNGAAPRLQRAVGREVRMKYTPQLTFTLDEGVVAGERIDAIFREIGSDEAEDEGVGDG